MRRTRPITLRAGLILLVLLAGCRAPGASDPDVQATVDAAFSATGAAISATEAADSATSAASSATSTAQAQAERAAALDTQAVAHRGRDGVGSQGEARGREASAAADRAIQARGPGQTRCEVPVLRIRGAPTEGHGVALILGGAMGRRREGHHRRRVRVHRDRDLVAAREPTAVRHSAGEKVVGCVLARTWRRPRIWCVQAHTLRSRPTRLFLN